MEKPREKLLLHNDAKELRIEELLSIILGHGTANINVYKLSEHLADFLRSKLNQQITIDDLTQFEGVGEAKAAQILSALELGRRFASNSIQKRLSDDDWDFADLKQSERQYGVHFFHHYTAKFIPQIPSKIIKQFAKSNDIVVDPFMGSGTALIEAKLLGCHSYGLDTNPLAVKIAKAKTMLMNETKAKEIDRFLEWVEKRKRYPDKASTNSLEQDPFPVIKSWFRPDVAYKINLILNEINNYSPDVQNFLQIGLSTLLKGMSNARMDSVTPVLPENPIYTDKKHYYREVNNLTRKIPVYGRVYSQINRMKYAIMYLNKETDNKLVCKPIIGDARELSKHVKHCDLIVTSPPYWSAQNYARIHMLSFKLFDIKTEEGKEIGRVSTSYLDDMEIVFNQIASILKGHFALVIGEDIKKRSNERLFSIAQRIGFHHVDTVTRRISNQVSRAKQIKIEFIYIFRI